MTENRGTARQRGYDSRWDKARRTHLAQYPWCQACAKAGRRAQAIIVDHIIPHRGVASLFWDRRNWQSLCSSCHSGDKQKAEKSGRSHYRGSSVDGSPLDPAHPWNRPQGGESKSSGPPPSGRTGKRSETRGREMKSGRIGITSPEASVGAESRALTLPPILRA